MDREVLDERAAAWLDELPIFVQAVTVEGDKFLAGTGQTFDPGEWQSGYSVGGWTVMSVTATSVRFRRKNSLLEG